MASLFGLRFGSASFVPSLDGKRTYESKKTHLELATQKQPSSAQIEITKFGIIFLKQMAPWQRVIVLLTSFSMLRAFSSVQAKGMEDPFIESSKKAFKVFFLVALGIRGKNLYDQYLVEAAAKLVAKGNRRLAKGNFQSAYKFFKAAYAKTPTPQIQMRMGYALFRVYHSLTSLDSEHTLSIYQDARNHILAAHQKMQEGDKLDSFALTAYAEIRSEDVTRDFSIAAKQHQYYLFLFHNQNRQRLVETKNAIIRALSEDQSNDRILIHLYNLAQIYFTLGNEFLDQEYLTASIELYTYLLTASKDKLDEFSSYLAIGDAYFQLRSYDLAIYNYHLVYNMNPEDPTLANQLGHAYLTKLNASREEGAEINAHDVSRARHYFTEAQKLGYHPNSIRDEMKFLATFETEQSTA